MEIGSLYTPKLLPSSERFFAGQRSCKGCGKALASRLIAKAAGSSVLTHEAIAARFPLAFSITAQGYDYDDAGFEDMLAGLCLLVDDINSQAPTPGHRLIKKPIICISRQAMMSDHLALDRMIRVRSDVVYICLDNEPYVDALIARAAPKPFVNAERLSPISDSDIDRFFQNKQMHDLLAHAQFSYVATACPSLPFDLVTKTQRALAFPGKAFLLVLTPCPTGWIFAPHKTVSVGLLAVQSGYFPLYEFADGTLKVAEHVRQRRPLADYLMLQKRFMPFPKELATTMQAALDRHWEELFSKGAEKRHGML